jgi:hypothetical protein
MSGPAVWDLDEQDGFIMPPGLSGSQWRNGEAGERRKPPRGTAPRSVASRECCFCLSWGTTPVFPRLPRGEAR